MKRMKIQRMIDEDYKDKEKNKKWIYRGVDYGNATDMEVAKTKDDANKRYLEHMLFSHGYFDKIR
jgi:hypothetical protein